ncbi:YigZ family protein [Roseivivax sp. CAU 1753]
MTRLTVLTDVLTDRGSKYAVSGGPVGSRGAARALASDLKRRKTFARATHDSWAILLPDGPIKQDNGEGGAGMVILKRLTGAGLTGHLVIVTRWFGGTCLGGDRFRNVKTATQTDLDHIPRA